MDEENRIVIATYSETGRTRTNAVYQHNYGQVLQLEGFEDLPDPFEMHFSPQINGKAVTQIGTGGVVRIPDECLAQRQPVFAWLFYHDTEGDGETVYTIEIPILARAEVSNREPTPVEQDAITQAIAALNAAVERINNIIDDTAGAGDTDKLWSADKSYTEIAGIKDGTSIPTADVSTIIENYEGS